MGAHAIIASLLLPILGAVSVLAASAADAPPAAKPEDDVCLQNNRLWSWNAPDNRTLNITDRQYRRFKISMSSGCVGLTTLINDIEIIGSASLACIKRGDRVRFREPNLGPMTCFINNIERIPDPPKTQGK